MLDYLLVDSVNILLHLCNTMLYLGAIFCCGIEALWDCIVGGISIRDVVAALDH